MLRSTWYESKFILFSHDSSNVMIITMDYYEDPLDVEHAMYEMS